MTRVSISCCNVAGNTEGHLSHHPMQTAEAASSCALYVLLCWGVSQKQSISCGLMMKQPDHYIQEEDWIQFDYADVWRQTTWLLFSSYSSVVFCDAFSQHHQLKHQENLYRRDEVLSGVLILNTTQFRGSYASLASCYPTNTWKSTETSAKVYSVSLWVVIQVQWGNP